MLPDYIICLQSQIESESNWSSAFGMIGQFFLLIVVFVAILFLAYFSTKWVASMRMGARKNDFMRLISSMPVGGNNSVQLIKVGEKYYLIGVSKENITYLTEITDINIPENLPGKNNFSFEKHFQDCFKRFKTNYNEKDDKEENEK